MKVTFLPSGEEHEIEFNETILHLAQRVGIHIQSVCKGIPSCAECRIQIVDGEHHVLPPNKKEVDLIGTAHYVDRSRLACQLRCFGDVTVDLKEQIDKASRMKDKPKERLARKDGKESQAVLGGILDNVVAGDVEITDEKLEDVEQVQVESFKGDPKLDRKNAFYGDFYTGKKKSKRSNKQGKKGGSKKRSSSKNAKSGGGTDSNQKASGASQSHGSGKKRNNRRRRRPSGGQGEGRSSNQGNN